MSIHLYKHNEDAYRAVETMLEEKQMAAVIHPTGTGKSMIAFKLVEQHPHKHFLWLSPSEYIYKTQLENIDTQFSNIEYMSYSRLMKHEDSIDTLHPDYIILDEFHRCGAAEWGKSVRKLLEAYPKAKRLGLSATNIRYLDNQRNMAEELFEGNIASEMTLGEAIVREILPEPKYVIAMYSYKKELEQLKKRIEGLSNPGLVSENEKLLEQLKRALEQADGLTEVFARQMTKPDGKYIVFCSGREHMDEMKAQAADWFSKVDKKPHIYTAYYNDASTSKAFVEFKKDTGSHLKLLYCIDMLNEGIHVDDVDGVILLRPTVSPIIYLQQIGRALSAGSKNQPVIFDLVNNFDSLYCIDCLKNEMQEAFLLYPDTHSPREHFDDRFRIIDETKDSREIFMRLQENLGNAWDTYYEAAKQWYEEKGNLKIPKSYVTGAGLTLGAWINTQRRVKSGNISGNLTWEKIQKLNDIGMIWDVMDSSWQEVLEELKSYRNTYGNLDIKAKYVSPTGFRLGSWINNMRFKVKKYGIEQALTDEQRKELEELGMIWDHNKQKWEEYYSAAKVYYKEHNLYLGRIVPTTAVYGIFAIVVLMAVYSKTKPELNLDYLKYGLKIALPLVLHSIALQILSQSDRVMITSLRNAAETGVYSLVYNLSMIATVITTSLDGIWVPWFTGKLKERKIREINVLAMDYVHLMTYAMVALILVGPEILKIFADQRYWEGMSIIPPIALANYMIFMYTMYVYIEHYYKKTVYITKNTLIAAGLNVILNFILIPKYGYVAAAYTTLASYFVAFILHSRYAKKIEPDIYPLKMFALPLLHVGGAIILYYPLLNFWTLRWGILFVYLIIVLIKERFRIGTLVPVLAEKCSFFKEK